MKCKQFLLLTSKKKEPVKSQNCSQVCLRTKSCFIGGILKCVRLQDVAGQRLFANSSLAVGVLLLLGRLQRLAVGQMAFSRLTRLPCYFLPLPPFLLHREHLPALPFCASGV